MASNVELSELGRQLAAAAVWAGLTTVPIANAIKNTVVDGAPGRLIESFSVPAATFAVLWHGREASEAQGAGVLRRMMDGRQDLKVQPPTRT